MKTESYLPALTGDVPCDFLSALCFGCIAFLHSSQGPFNVAMETLHLLSKSNSIIRLLEGEEAERALQTADTFVSSMSLFDRQSRLSGAKSVTQEDYLSFVVQHVITWTADAKAAIQQALTT